MTKLPKPVNLELFEEMIVQLIAETRKLGLPNARIRDLQDAKIVIKQIRKAREKP